MKDYYSLLGLEQKATKAEIKKNYRQLATKYHPDKNSDPGAAAIFVEITEAYDTLNNRKSRAAYDLSRWQTIKNKEADSDYFTTAVPTAESTRSRRNKAQEKRGTKYHQAGDQVGKTSLLIWESLHIISRYIIPIIGMTLMAVILASAAPQILTGFESSLGIGIGTGIFVILLIWGLLKISLYLFTEIKKDIVLFSIYYKITHRKALHYFIINFGLALIVYMLMMLKLF